jgi:hypothetical protein
VNFFIVFLVSSRAFAGFCPQWVVFTCESMIPFVSYTVGDLYHRRRVSNEIVSGIPAH